MKDKYIIYVCIKIHSKYIIAILQMRTNSILLRLY